MNVVGVAELLLGRAPEHPGRVSRDEADEADCEGEHVDGRSERRRAHVPECDGNVMCEHKAPSAVAVQPAQSLGMIVWMRSPPE